MSDSRDVTIAEAVELTGLSKKSIQNRIDQGRLPATVRDGRRRIRLADLEVRGLLKKGLPKPKKDDHLAELAERLERAREELGDIAAELRVESRRRP